MLFQTCYVQHNEPEIGKDTVEVLQHNQVDITCEAGLNCCGMPAWESGDLDTMQKKASANLDKLLPHVEAGKKVLAINPTCSMMLRQEYPELVADADRDKAATVADAVMDPAEFLWSIRKEERFNEDFKSTPGDVSYHAPCHLRRPGRRLQGARPHSQDPRRHALHHHGVLRHDGTYAMKTEGFEVSVRIGKKAFDGMNAASDAEVWATDCRLRPPSSGSTPNGARCTRCRSSPRPIARTASPRFPTPPARTDPRDP